MDDRADNRPRGARQAGPQRHDEEIAAERREAARLLLAHPLIVSTGRHADGFRLVRRHAEPLKALFAQHLGYRLIVEAGFARLVKAGLGRASERRLVRSTGAPFTPRTYSYLALALSVLVSSAEQLLLSQLVADIRAAAVDAGIELSDPERQTERRTIAAALRQLVDWAVVGEVDGTVLGYVEDERRDALLSVDREVARTLVAGPLRAAATAADLIGSAADAGPGGSRHGVRRRLTESPVVHLDDLEADDRAWLRREQRREERIAREQFGLDMEIRAEGALLVDPLEATTDVAFPGTGTVPQAALLTLGHLVGRLGPDGAGDRLVIGVPIPDRLLDDVLAEVTSTYARSCGWARHYVEDPAALRRDVCALLVGMGLVASARPEPGGTAETPPDSASVGRRVVDVRGARGSAESGWVLLAAAARYRPTAVASPRPRHRPTGRAET